MKKITAEIWKKAIISASNNLQNKKNTINALNVFPVPDGDTGSNMASTILAAAELKTDNMDSLASVAKNISQSMLLSARGNSGVILSQIFKGFANGFKDKNEATVFDVVKAFTEAQKSAYKAVLKPIEGTILTVIREIAEGLNEQITIDADIEQVFAIAKKLARTSCDNTPKLLKVLSEVGVTDSGGEGLYAIIEGMNAYFNDAPIEILNSDDTIDKFISDTEVYNGEFGYCTEFILELTKDNNFNKESLIKKLEKIGNSMVVVHDEDLVKVHIHTMKPGDVLNTVNSSGQFIKIKIENMTLQANSSKETAEKNKKSEANTLTKPCGLVSCNSGQGIIDIIRENGVSYVVEGGQTNNPSIQDIVNAINAVDANTVFILPNNSNIILSAQQAATIVRDKKTIIIPTKSQAQTLSIVLNFSPDNSEKDNQMLMSEALRNIKYGEIAPSIKNTKLNGIKVKKDEFMVIVKNKLKSTAKTPNEAAQKLIDEIVDSETQLVTIFYGQDVSETEAKEIQNYIEISYGADVEIISGAQTIYPYLISAE
ncbi:DAK2 domain-containing protein [Metamycoplasma equirhinis]|uniref:DAK2 domain-containing protein n=1 Tax=Metamycoplasma equirhinis TaxID=92402 RepID=UPI0035941DA0